MTTRLPERSGGLAWRIYSYDPESGEGQIASPFYGPWSFDRAANVQGVHDFSVGEVVFATIGRIQNGRGEVLEVFRPVSRELAMPAGTRCERFDQINSASLEDSSTLRDSADELILWFYYCCASCSPGFLVRFDSPICSGKPETGASTAPWLRLATPEEVEAAGLAIREDDTLYALLLGGPDDPPDPRVTVVASPRVTVAPATRQDLVDLLVEPTDNHPR